MKDITQHFGQLYFPKSALVLYQSSIDSNGLYVEAFDMDDNGYPVNAHPLSLKESQLLAKMLDLDRQLGRCFLTPSGLMAQNILHINPAGEGCVLWYTPAHEANLLFSESLGIASGKAFIPPLVWKASPKSLYVYAIKNDNAIKEKTILYKAPFFNIHPDGRVCMGR